MLAQDTTFKNEFYTFWEYLFAPENLAKLLNTIISIALIIVFGLVLNFVLQRTIGKVLDSSEKKGRKTLVSVLSSALKYIVYFFMICAILEQFGIPTASLLTVAGVGSVAIGFGAQSIVKDVLTGIFILTESQFGVDDIIEIKGKVGKVEAIGLRTTTFRNVVNSEVYIVPNSEISFVTNLTKGYHRAVVNIEIPFEPDLDTTLRILKDEMDNFDGGDAIYSQPEVQGITDFVESAMNIRIICDCKPGEAWRIEREIRRTLKNRIESEGIFIPYSTRTVHLVPAEQERMAE